jgi:hypothetical protein
MININSCLNIYSYYADKVQNLTVNEWATVLETLIILKCFR